MNMNQYSRTLHDVANLQQMQGIFSNQESSFTFIKQMKSRSKAVGALAIPAAILPLAVNIPISMKIYTLV